VAELDATLGSGEFTEWLAFYELEPFGVERDNYHTALLAALIANVHRGKGKPAFKIEDFMLRDPETKKASETQRTIAQLAALAKPKTDG